MSGMVSQDTVEAIRNKAQAYFHASKPTHDWSHIERVYALVEKIAEREHCNLDIVRLATLLHDIGRDEADANGVCHAELSAELARPLLVEHDIPREIIDQVLYCVRTHRFRGDNKPESIEAKVLYDADKLDAIGAIGICRAYSYAGENGQKLYSSFDPIDLADKRAMKVTDHSQHTPVIEFAVKLHKIKDKMLTEEGKRIAEERDRFMRAFYHRLKLEIEGEE